MPRRPTNIHPLRTVREAAGLTQAQLAKRIGQTASAVQKMELGKMAITEATADKICHQLGCQMAFVENPETGGQGYQLVDFIQCEDEAGFPVRRPYEKKDFIEHQLFLKNLPAEYPDGWAEALGYVLHLVLLAAVAAGRGPAVAEEFQQSISNLIKDFDLHDNLTTVLCEKLGVYRDDGAGKAEGLALMPIQVGRILMALAQGSAESPSGGGDSTRRAKG